MDDLLGFGFGVLVIWVVGCFGWFGLHLRLCDRLVSGDGWAIWLYLAFGWCFAVCWVWWGLAGCCCAGLGLVGLGVLGLAGYCLVSYCGLWFGFGFGFARYVRVFRSRFGIGFGGFSS